MQRSAIQRALRLTVHLVTRPKNTARYLQNYLIARKTPLDMEIPWMAYDVIDFLDSYLRPDMKVFEYGSGGSTLFFAKRVDKVFSVEDDPEWYELVCSRLKEKGFSNATLTLKPFNFWESKDFEESEYLHSLPDTPFDVYVIDGQEGADRVRPICFSKVERAVKAGGIIVLDDSWRYEQLRENNQAKRVQTYTSVGPFRPGVTCTDVFFY